MGLTKSDVTQARDGYLEAWTDLADRGTLRALADAAVHVQAAARALSWDRALLAADAAERDRWGAPVARWLAVLAGVNRDGAG